jgi:hypothetical protein
LQSLKAVKQGGLISVFGIWAEVWEGLGFCGEKGLRLKVEKVFGWSEEGVRGALELVGKREAVGKIVVSVGEA